MEADASPNSLRLKWLNLILHLTAHIAERKRALQTEHVMRTALDVLMIIIFEGVLAVISLPIYFTKSDALFSLENEFVFQYHVRKFFSFLLIPTVAAAAIAQFAFVATVSTWPGQQMTFQTGSQFHSSVFSQDSFLAYPLNTKIPVPVITSVRSDSTGHIHVEGTASMGKRVRVVLVPQDASRKVGAVRMVTPGMGNWFVDFQTNPYDVSQPTYSITAEAFDQELDQKSPPSSVTTVKVCPPWFMTVVALLALVLKISALALIGIGFLVFFLTL